MDTSINTGPANRAVIITIAGALILILLAVGILFFYKYKNKADDALKNVGDTTEMLEGATKGVLPSLPTVTNPLENKPDLNPVDKANPMKNIKTNPFE